MSKGLIGGLTVVVGVLAIATVAVLMASGDDSRRTAAISTASRTYVAGKSLLYDGSKQLGYLDSFQGCNARGNVVEAKGGTDPVTRKHISNVIAEPCVIRFGAEMDATVFTWMKDTLGHSPSRKNLWIVETDFNYVPKSGIQLGNAAISKIALPAFSAQDAKQPLLFELTLEPELVKDFEPCCGSFSPTVAKGLAPRTKSALTSNFKVTISGMTKAEGVTKVSAWSATQTMPEDSIGEVREVVKEPAVLSLGNLELTVSRAKSAAFDDWFEDFVVDGHNGQANERTLTVDVYDQTLTTVLASFTFDGVGIFRAARSGSGEQSATKIYSLYVEEADLTIGTPTVSPPPAPPAAPPASPPPPAETEPTETTPTETERAETEPTEGEQEPLREGPASLKAATAGESEVELAWQPVEGAEAYLILASLDPGGPYDEVGTASETGTIVSGLKSGATYHFVVRALVKEAETGDSPEATATAG